MCEGPTSGHRELWEAGSTLPPDQGPEGNVKMWREAEEELDHLCEMHERGPNEALLTALTDTYNRCIEEGRWAEDLLRLHKWWEGRRIGGVMEIKSPVRDQPTE